MAPRRAGRGRGSGAPLGQVWAPGARGPPAPSAVCVPRADRLLQRDTGDRDGGMGPATSAGFLSPVWQQERHHRHRQSRALDVRGWRLLRAQSRIEESRRAPATVDTSPFGRPHRRAASQPVSASEAVIQALLTREDGPSQSTRALEVADPPPVSPQPTPPCPHQPL